MKALAIVACCALFAGVARSECVLMSPRESSSHVRIAVVLGGKPLKGAKVSFYHSHDCTCASDMLRGNPWNTSINVPVMSELTGDDGTASPPELPNGGYDVIATLNDVVGTSFVGLQVVGKQEVTTFSMDLTEQVRRVEVPPIRDHVKAFQGIVTDPAGAALPGASIVVVRKESEAKDVALRLKAGANGHFSAHLAEGSYIAFFFLRGFRTAIVPLEVTKDGAGDLRASLQVQSCP